MSQHTVADTGYRITHDDLALIRAQVTWPPDADFGIESKVAAALAHPLSGGVWRVTLVRDRVFAYEHVDCVNRDMASLLVHWWAGLLAQVAAAQAVSA